MKDERGWDQSIASRGMRSGWIYFICILIVQPAKSDGLIEEYEEKKRN